MSGRRSRNKGASGERDIVNMLRAAGFHAYRGCSAQASTNTKPADVEIDALVAGLVPWIEVKRMKRPNILGAWDQARADTARCRVPREPIVITRRDRGEWLLTMSFESALEVGVFSPPNPARTLVDRIKAEIERHGSDV